MSNTENAVGVTADRRKTCKWSKFDGQWGDYKCKLFYIGLSDHYKCDRCKKYGAKTK